MNFRAIGWLLFVLLLSAGCRRDAHMDAYFDMLNAEKRVLEDRLFEAEYKHEKALKELQACRTKAGNKDGARSGAPSREEPEWQDNESDLPDLDIFIPPFDDQSTSIDSTRIHAATQTTSAGRSPAKLPPSKNEIDPAPIPPDLTDRRVAQLYINPRRTRGEDFDGQPGDDGVSILIEPRTRNGEFIPRSGRVSIVLLDPSREGDEAKLGRWDFEEATVRKLLRTDSLDRGFWFRIPWAEQRPRVSRVRLYVRYLDEDGTRWDAEREITVNQPGLVARAWTPRPSTDTPEGTDTLESHAQSEIVTYNQPVSVAAQPTQPNPVADDAAEPRDREKSRPTRSAAVPQPPGRFWKPYR